jgi:hypothetical protein
MVSACENYTVVPQVAQTWSNPHPAFVSLNQVTGAIKNNIIALNYNRLHDYIACKFVVVA